MPAFPKLAALFVFASLGACTVGPDYVAPKIDLETGYVAGGGSSLTEPATQAWWQGFDDPVLNTLVTQGLSQNLDIRASLARVEQAEATLRGTGLNAQLSGTGTLSRTTAGTDLTTSNTTANSATLNGTYVLDLFGGTRRAREQALANLEAAGFNLGDARLALLTSLVTNYVNMRFAQEAAALNRQTITSRRDTLDLVRQREIAGRATELDIAQAEADLFASQADLQGYLANFESSVFAIATLLDQNPSALLTKLQMGAPQPNPRGGMTRGSPADLLRNLPSVRSAERNYAAAVAAVGVAESNLLPSLSLSGTLTLSDPNSWSYGPALSLPILNQGALSAARDTRVALAKEAELQWRAAVRRAVEDVETSASGLHRARHQISLQSRAVAASSKSLDLSRKNFEGGSLSLVDLLVEERNATSRKLSRASAVRDMALEWASLQIALGRGWNVGGLDH